ncbi:HpcH/HpaI aldolase/citrate lyase family protein [Pseudovirgaria hyperparasitica]|uniref:HpcH/HpaI aldolase/citrate lyase family protein n=1 Tax=Pseudovirgaria hyperparasitica TaxID=470096 RepID=A0A6A6VVC5_9PEZI|nr:HpcH/HpaI aldolase/citrate lyase family protein [Pseudovirgaria hyperparasitica]KAF2753570.1 HpcH/HpaI aldolase/citrate lyase family protein [Pseudovirgaria hyperparasitica]
MLNTKEFNALDLAQPTNFNAMMKSGELLWGTTCRIPSEESARILASLPHQFCFIDSVLISAFDSEQEHTPIGPTELARLIRAIQYFSCGSMVPLVRVPANSPDLITYALNAGAGGVIKPHIQNATEAREFAKLARFPPHGIRSFPPGAFVGDQARAPPGKSVYDVWNEHIAVICQIEDVEGVRNIDEIAGVAGVDALMVGASDLRFSLGLEAGSPDGDEECFVQSLSKIQRAAKRHGLPVLGFGTSPEVLRKRIALGWTAFVIHSDVAGLFQSGIQSLETFSGAALKLKQVVTKSGLVTNGEVRTLSTDSLMNKPDE